MVGMAFSVAFIGSNNHFDCNEMLIAFAILAVFFAAFSGIARGVSNVIQFHYEISAFNDNPSYNPKISWMNKWKNGDPKQGERFWGSSRWFVLFTDKWHLYESLHRVFLIGAFTLYGYMMAQSLWWLFGLIALYVVFATAFHLSYELLY